MPLLLVFAFTLFVSATLLFLVQPMIGKTLLPMLGGTPAVWNTCMVFFQALLLAGYAYAHAATALLGLHPIAARLIAISLAMVVAWLMHRTLTFAVTTPPSVAEFLRYAGVAWTAAALNYGLFVAILLARPGTEPLLALAVSAGAAMAFAYLGMRFAAFEKV